MAHDLPDILGFTRCLDVRNDLFNLNLVGFFVTTENSNCYNENKENRHNSFHGISFHLRMRYEKQENVISDSVKHKNIIFQDLAPAF